MTAEMIQFATIVLMTLLTLKLLTLNGRALKSDIINTSRWLMTVGTTLLLVQFTTQMTLGLRAMGITQGVMLNLLMFVPTSWVFSLSLLYLQRQGHLNKWDKKQRKNTLHFPHIIRMHQILAFLQPYLRIFFF